ncbi:MAG: hypothetical protein P8L77_03100, partial [Gammaproteobacteria bacterium]|nr:hypothetical protein [Gammaproteobacteria bacterium]
TGLAGFIAITSSILFFSFYVSSVMVHETDERKFIVARDLPRKTSQELPLSNLFTEHASIYQRSASDQELADEVEPLFVMPATGLGAGRETDRL